MTRHNARPNINMQWSHHLSFNDAIELFVGQIENVWSIWFVDDTIFFMKAFL